MRFRKASQAFQRQRFIPLDLARLNSGGTWKKVFPKNGGQDPLVRARGRQGESLR